MDVSLVSHAKVPITCHDFHSGTKEVPLRFLLCITKISGVQFVERISDIAYLGKSKTVVVLPEYAAFREEPNQFDLQMRVLARRSGLLAAETMKSMFLLECGVLAGTRSLEIFDSAQCLNEHHKYLGVVVCWMKSSKDTILGEWSALPGKDFVIENNVPMLVSDNDELDR